MKRLLLCLLCLTSPALARADGLIDLNPAEAKVRNAQKDIKKGVDKETDKHKVTIGGDDAKKPSKKPGKSKSKAK